MTDLSGFRLPKLNGGDIELANFVLGLPGVDTGGMASRALLAEIEGLPRARSFSNTSFTGASSCGRGKSDAHDDRETQTNGGWSAQDWGRKFLPTNGGCVYIDLDHLELCLPEVLSAWDHVAAWHAMLRIARDAMDAANSKLPEGRSLQVLVNNSDGHGHSYGSHLNFLVTRQLWESIMRRKPHYLGWLARFRYRASCIRARAKWGRRTERRRSPSNFPSAPTSSRRWWAPRPRSTVRS